MAVLKRGDNTERWQLAASRKFAASFALAWNVWTKHLHGFLRRFWLPCLIAGLAGVAWLVVRSGIYSYGFDLRVMAVDLLGGSVLLFVWSLMRTMQLDTLLHLEQGAADVATTSFAGNILSLTKRTWQPFLPLLTAWVLLYLIIYIPLSLGAGTYVVAGCLVAALLLPMSVGGMVQSYMEAEKQPLFAGLWKGLRLNRRYWGGMAALWVISLLILAVVAAVLLFGEVIINYTFANQHDALAQEEHIAVPVYVLLMRYAVMLAALWLLTFAQSLWSLPQQVHIRSILHKESLRTPKQSAEPSRQDSDDGQQPHTMNQIINS